MTLATADSGDSQGVHPHFEIKCHRKESPNREAEKNSALAAERASGQVSEPQIPQGLISRCIDRHTKDRPLPLAIGRFLDTYWRHHLLLSYPVDGEDSRCWREALKTMDELIWSVQPKEDTACCRRLFKMLPQLYQRLHLDLKPLGMGEAEQDIFFAELAKLHQAALNPRPSAGVESPLGKAQSDRAGEKAVEQYRDASNAFEAGAPGVNHPNMQSSECHSSQIVAPASDQGSGIHRHLAQLWSDPTQIWFC